MMQGIQSELMEFSQVGDACRAVSGSARAGGSAGGFRLVVVSPVRLVREGLVASLGERQGVIVVDAVGLDPMSITRAAGAVPDVVLVDLTCSDMVGTARKLKLACPNAKLVAFALDEVDDDVFACAAAGYSGYVPREGGADDLYRVVVDALGGKMHCAPHIAAAMFHRLADLLPEKAQRALLPILTSRESEILALTEQGCSNKEIARCLAISSATVKNHMHSILQKLHVSRRGQAVARLRAVRGG